MYSAAQVLILCIVWLIVSKLANGSPFKGNDQVLIVVSFDGFRPEDMTETKTPNLYDLRKYSTRAKKMKMIFPTKTFPNHFTISTGLYADKHGVVENTFYDPELDQEIKYSAEMFYYKKDIKPIWILNEMSGGISGCMMWSGSNFKFKEKGCTYLEEYKEDANLNDMVDTAIKWLRDPANPVNLIMMYIADPDKIGHAYGSNSERFPMFCLSIAIYFVLWPVSDVNSASTFSAVKANTIVISFNGFRYDLISEERTPNMYQLQKEGIYADQLRGVFPTKTLPNHFSIATGLYPGSHGVLASDLFDRRTKKELSYSTDLFHSNESVLPIWIVNEINGGISGCMMWPGSDFSYQNRSCTYTVKYKLGVSVSWVVDTILQWLTNSRKPSNFIMVYVSQPDREGHFYGLGSKGYWTQLKRVDEMAGYLHKKLRSKCINHRTNVVHLSDHGMIDITQDKILNLTTFLAPEGNYKIYGTSPVLQIVPEEGKKEEVQNALMKAATASGKFKIYGENTLPPQWHIKNPRLGPIVAVANLGYVFQDFRAKIERYKKKYNITVTNSSKFGVHGYDNSYPQMSGFFMARGPYFRKNRKVGDVSSINLFELFCHILDIKDVPQNDGSLSAWNDVLNGQNIKVIIWSILTIAIMAAFVIVATIIFIIFEKRKSYLIWS